MTILLEKKGYFGDFGGQFVAETLIAPLKELEEQYNLIKEDPEFWDEHERLMVDVIGRPTPLTPCQRLSEYVGGAQIFLKREDLTHTGAHKINNALSQALLAKRMGKTRIVAETGAGQHGVAVASACSLLNLECTIYMGAVDAQRQAPNVKRMELLGADLRQVSNGSQTLKDAVSEAIRDWITHVGDTHYLMGSVVGPHPFPTIVRDFQSIIGREARGQFLEKTGQLPQVVIACVGGGSNAIGIFSAFVNDSQVQLLGVQAAGEGLDSGKHAAPLIKGTPGVLQGARSLLLQDPYGQVLETHSIAPGLDYPAGGPEHCYLKSIDRVRYESITNQKALEAFSILCRLEGIIPALESSHAVAKAIEVGKVWSASHGSDAKILVNLSGRGDKDLDSVMEALSEQNYRTQQR